MNELEWNGSKYVATLTDTNGLLGNYNFSANIDGVSFSVSGNKLTVSMNKAPSKEFTITAAKKNGVRRGVVVWTDGIHQNGNGIKAKPLWISMLQLKSMPILQCRLHFPCIRVAQSVVPELQFIISPSENKPSHRQRKSLSTLNAPFIPLTTA